MSPREALDAWNTQVGIHVGKIDLADAVADEDDEQRTIANAVKTFLSQVKATNSVETFRAYTKDIAWFTSRLVQKYVNKVNREAIIDVLGEGRADGLAQSSINRRVLVGLMTLRNAGATLPSKVFRARRCSDATPRQKSGELLNPKSYFSMCGLGSMSLHCSSPARCSCVNQWSRSVSYSQDGHQQ